MTFPSLIPGKLKRVLARHRSTAARGERLVARYLRRNGYRVLATNLRVGRGEIDIVAETPDRRAIAIVEVKSCDRRHASRPPEIRVGRNKQRQLTVLAMRLVRRHGLARRLVRFDVAGVDLEDDVVRYHAGAFQAQA